MFLYTQDLFTNTAKIVLHQVKQPLFIGFFGLGAIEYFSYKPFHKHINPNNQCDWQYQNEQQKFTYAIDAVRQKGYGVVMPIKEEITLEDPVIVKQGNKYGVKIKATAPSIHMIRANIETEISPLVGSENQASDLIKYIGQSGTEEGNIWGTNIFGKSIEELVEDGIKSKVYQIGEESQIKLQETMQKIVNDNNGGLVCIII